MIAPPGYSYDINPEAREIEIRYQGSLEAIIPLRAGQLAEIEELRELRRYLAYEWMKVNLPKSSWTVEDVVSHCVIATDDVGGRRAIAFRFAPGEEVEERRVACQEAERFDASPYILAVDDAAHPERCVTGQIVADCG